MLPAGAAADGERPREPRRLDSGLEAELFGMEESVTYQVILRKGLTKGQS